MRYDKLRIFKELSLVFTMVIMLLLFALQAAAEEPLFLKSSFPDGFRLKEPVKFYNAENLYEYINGQAVFYFSYGFK